MEEEEVGGLLTPAIVPKGHQCFLAQQKGLCMHSGGEGKPREGTKPQNKDTCKQI